MENNREKEWKKYIDATRTSEGEVWSFRHATEDIMRINLDDATQEKIEIIIEHDTRILLKNHQNRRIVHFIINPKAKLVLNIMSTTNFVGDELVFDVNENASVNVAYADFSFGSGEAKATFNLLKNRASAIWNLASLGAKKDKKVFNVNFKHQASNTYANMSNYGVVEEQANMHFLGVSHIEKGASKSITHQTAKIMVFDEKCIAKANPILKIDENDIEASHAAAVGKVNDEHMFYLRSRGLHEQDAKQLITLGYLKPIVSYFMDTQAIEEITQAIEKQVSL